MSSSRRTCHLDITYFFVTDKITEGKVKVTFCPTHEMLGDFFTKPLQSTEHTVHTNARKNPKSTQHYKYSCAQECVVEGKKRKPKKAKRKSKLAQKAKSE